MAIDEGYSACCGLRRHRYRVQVPALSSSPEESVRFGAVALVIGGAPRGASSTVEQRTFNPLVQGSSPWRPTSDQGFYLARADWWLGA